MVTTTTFRCPCVRCNRVLYLEVTTGLCVTIEPKPERQVQTCFEWWCHYWLPTTEREAA